MSQKLNNWFRNLRIRNKLMGGFGTIQALLVIIAIVVYVSINSMLKISGWVTHTYKVLGDAKNIGAAMIDQETGMRGFMVAGSDNFLEPYNAGKKSFEEVITSLKETVSDNPAQVERLEEIENLAEEWHDIAADPQIELRRNVDRGTATMDEVVARINEALGKTYMDSIRVVLNDFSAAEEVLLDVRADELESITSKTVLTLIFGSLIALVLGTLISYFFSVDVSSSIARAVNLAKEISKGDLSHRLNVTTTNEIGELAQALDLMSETLSEKEAVTQEIANGNFDVSITLASEKDQLGISLRKMVDTLNDILQRVQEAGNHFSDSAADLSQVSESVFEGATSSASSLEETASSMAEMESQTTSNAQNARKANELASEAAKSASTGQNKMLEMTEAMKEISANADETQKVIKTIDDIAFQTNLLALNAAVEAARAGSHGKGFAVVADEVRNLAQRSAKAAGETAALLENSSRQIAEGVTVSQGTADALTEINEHIHSTSDLIKDISQASDEQSTGISQVNIALNQLDSVTQQNAGNAETMTSSAMDMTRQADELQLFVGKFTIRGGSRTKRVILNSAPEPTPVQQPKPLSLGDNSYGEY